MRRMPEVIFDNCVLSNFSLSDSLDIIKRLYASSAHITDFVAAENLTGILKGHGRLKDINNAIREGWLKETALSGDEEKRLFESLAVSLGFGEASAIAVAKMRGYVFACDDRAARREAALLGVRLTGTLGILIKATKKKIISVKRADEILGRMIENGFYAPVSSLKDLPFN
jgi:predicted nucleic acid-binding protein